MPKLQDARESQKARLASKTRAGVVDPVTLFVPIVSGSIPQGRSSMDAYSISPTRRENENVRRYGLAMLAAIIALLLRRMLTPLLGESYPYHTLWAATVFCAWYCGLGPSILTALAGVVGIWYWFLPPVHSFELQDPKAEISEMLGFMVFAGLIIVLGEANRRSLARSKWTEEQLQKAHDELEHKVQERTADLNVANESL